MHKAITTAVVPGRLELPTSTLSVWRSDRLSYRTIGRSRPDGLAPASQFSLGVFPKRQRRAYKKAKRTCQQEKGERTPGPGGPEHPTHRRPLQKGGVPAAPSGTATLLRLSPNHRFCPRPFLAVTDFRHPRLSWLDGRCVQGPGTYSPRHG